MLLSSTFTTILIIIFIINCTSNSFVSCASFSPSSRHHEPSSASSSNQHAHRLHPPPSISVHEVHSNPKPMSAALRSVRAPASLEIMPMGDIKKAVGESFVVICRGSQGVPVTDLKWFNPRGEEMFPSKDFSIISTNNHEKKQLAFMNPTINDAGVYICSGKARDADLLEAKVRVVIYGECFFLDFSQFFCILFHLFSDPISAPFLFFPYPTLSGVYLLPSSMPF